MRAVLRSRSLLSERLLILSYSVGSSIIRRPSDGSMPNVSKYKGALLEHHQEDIKFDHHVAALLTIGWWCSFAHRCAPPANGQSWSIQHCTLLFDWLITVDVHLFHIGV